MGELEKVNFFTKIPNLKKDQGGGERVGVGGRWMDS